MTRQRARGSEHSSDSDQPLREFGMHAGETDKSMQEVHWISWNMDLYDITAVACFGGLRIELESSTSFFILHPVWPFLACAVLAVIQIIIISAVALENSAHKFHGKGSLHDLATLTDFLLVFVLQAKIFAELHQGLKMLFFALIRCRRRQPLPPKGDCLLSRKCFRHPAILAIFMAFSSLCKIVVAYLASTTCLTIILRQEKTTDAVFNSLVLTFVMELDDIVWVLLQSAVDLKVCDPMDPKGDKEFRFQLCKVSDGKVFSMRLIVGIIESMFIFDQVTNALVGFSTTWLPTTRMICGSSQDISAVFAFFQNGNSSWAPDHLNEVLSFCDEQGFNAWTLPDKYRKVNQEHWIIWPLCILIIFIFVGFPPLLRCALRHCTREQKEKEDLSDEDTEHDSEEGFGLGP